MDTKDSGRLFFTSTEVADMFRTDPRTVRRAVESGQIPGTRLCGVVRIPASWVRAQIDNTPDA